MKRLERRTRVIKRQEVDVGNSVLRQGVPGPTHFNNNVAGRRGQVDEEELTVSKPVGLVLTEVPGAIARIA